MTKTLRDELELARALADEFAGILKRLNLQAKQHQITPALLREAINFLKTEFNLIKHSDTDLDRSIVAGHLHALTIVLEAAERCEQLEKERAEERG